MRHRSERVEIQLLEDIANILLGIDDSLRRLVALFNLPYQSTTATLSKENDMPIEVGATEVVTLTFQDAAGEATTPPTGDGSGIVVTIASDNEAVATVGATTASADTAVATATGVAEGSFNYTATVANTSGAPLLDNDGATVFVQPTPLAETVTAPPHPRPRRLCSLYERPADDPGPAEHDMGPARPEPAGRVQGAGGGDPWGLDIGRDEHGRALPQAHLRLKPDPSKALGIGESHAW